MAENIHVLDSDTIDKIAAGEVVEKPASVVKELIENSIDAGADKITVEIKEGGISFIRVTDNGCGIEKGDLYNAFLRHATSKIQKVEDLNSIHSLGFRGEALSSISAVAQVEMITKTKDSLMGVKICCNGGVIEKPEEIGAPDGTTVLVRNLFYNTPVRKKFLHTSMTEGSYVGDLMQHIAMSHPYVSISYIQNGQTKFFASGNGELSEIIYRIYGRDVSEHMISIDKQENGIRVWGFIGKPLLARANRNYENFFINGRYIKSKLISAAVEEGYKTFLMQHKYPFAVLHFQISGEDIDVNVHPTKMEIRIMDPQPFCEFVKKAVNSCLSAQILIPEYFDGAKKEEKPVETKKAPEPFEINRQKQMAEPVSADRQQIETKPSASDSQQRAPETFADSRQPQIVEPFNSDRFRQRKEISYNNMEKSTEGNVREEISGLFKILGNPPPRRASGSKRSENIIKPEEVVTEKEVQMELFSTKGEQPDENRLSGLEIIGQVFKTYWIVEFEGKIYFVDQHAAHEKVNYENWIKKLKNKENTTQMLMPSLIISLSPREMGVMAKFADVFTNLGFIIEAFGGGEIALRGIPQDLYGSDEKQLFLDILDELVETPIKGTPDVITAKIASMSCKAAVKGNQSLSVTEARELLKQLFALDNPFHCPHGRPTMFSMSKYELEKKFKRIL